MADAGRVAHGRLDVRGCQPRFARRLAFPGRAVEQRASRRLRRRLDLFHRQQDARQQRRTRVARCRLRRVEPAPVPQRARATRSLGAASPPDRRGPRAPLQHPPDALPAQRVRCRRARTFADGRPPARRTERRAGVAGRRAVAEVAAAAAAVAALRAAARSARSTVAARAAGARRQRARGISSRWRRLTPAVRAATLAAPGPRRTPHWRCLVHLPGCGARAAPRASIAIPGQPSRNRPRGTTGGRGTGF